MTNVKRRHLSLGQRAALELKKELERDDYPLDLEGGTTGQYGGPLRTAAKVPLPDEA